MVGEGVVGEGEKRERKAKEKEGEWGRIQEDR
jgi:hypothetical protein